MVKKATEIQTKKLLHLLRSRKVIDLNPNDQPNNLNLWSFSKVLSSLGLSWRWNSLPLNLSTATDSEILGFILEVASFVHQQELVVIRNKQIYEVSSGEINRFVDEFDEFEAFFSEGNDYVLVSLSQKKLLLINYHNYYTIVDVSEKKLR